MAAHKAEAERVIAESKAKHHYPRRKFAPQGRGYHPVPESVMQEAFNDLANAAIRSAHCDGAADKAKLHLYEKIAKWVEFGIPYDVIKMATGIKTSDTIRRTIRDKLPRYRKKVGSKNFR